LKVQIFIIVGCLLATPVFAGDYKVPAQWAHCDHSDECVIVDGGCGVERAANKGFAAQVKFDMPTYECTKPLESHAANTVTKCDHNLCVLSPPGFVGGR
jgi:hypothetical protein